MGKTAQTVTIGGFASATALTNAYWTRNILAAANRANIDNTWAFFDGAKSNWSSSTTAIP